MPVPTRDGELALTIERFADDHVALTARGDLDITTVHALRAELEAIIAARPGALTLDLTGVGFMDSVSLAAMVWASRELGGADRLLIVVGPDSYARLILDASGLSACLNVVTSQGQA